MIHRFKLKNAVSRVPNGWPGVTRYSEMTKFESAYMIVQRTGIGNDCASVGTANVKMTIPALVL